IGPQGRTQLDADAARSRGAEADLQRDVESQDCGLTRLEREHDRSAPREHHGDTRHPQDRRARRLRDAAPLRPVAVNPRRFLTQVAGGGAAFALGRTEAGGQNARPLAVRLTDVTAASGLSFRHNNGSYGGQLLPETLGSGCAFFDYDADGWQDIILINGAD